MKNKKLFAILTLVCFMFTLMPVAAFAAPITYTVCDGGNVARVTDRGIDFSVKASEARDWEAGDIVAELYSDDIKLTQMTLQKDYVDGDADEARNASPVMSGVIKYDGSGSGSWDQTAWLATGAIVPTDLVIYVDGEKIGTAVVAFVNGTVVTPVENDKATWEAFDAVANATVAGNIDDATSTFVAEDGDQSVKIGEDVVFELDVEDKIYGPAAGKVFIWAEETAGKASSALTVKGATPAGIDNVYVINVVDYADVTVNFARAGEYTVYAAPAVAVGTDSNEVVELSKFDCEFSVITVKSGSVDPEESYYANGVLADGELAGVNVVPNNVFSNKQTVTFTVNGQPMKGKTIAIETNSSSIEVSKASDKTDSQGRIDFEIAGTIEGTYEVVLSVDGVEWTIPVTVSNTTATYINTIAQPTAPIALHEGIGTEVKFAITDINGNAVTDATNEGLEGIYGNAKANNVDGRNYKEGSFVVLTEAPEDSRIESDDLGLKATNGIWVLTGLDNLDAEGTYAVKVILDNGAYATAEFAVKKFDKPVRLIIGAALDTVELGATIKGELKYMDKNGVMKLAKDAELVADGYAVAAVNTAIKDGEFNFAVKSDEKYVGAVVKTTAVSEKYDLVATKEFKVVAGAVAVEFATVNAEANVNNKLTWNVVDENGNKVALMGGSLLDATKAQNIKTEIKYVVLDKPEGAKVSVSDKTVAGDLIAKGIGQMALTSNKVGVVEVQVVVRAEYPATGNAAPQIKYYTGTAEIAVGLDNFEDVVVMSIGSKEIVINSDVKEMLCEAVIKDGRTFVPFRAGLEALGATVDYVDGQVIAEMDGVKVVMEAGKTAYTVNGVAKTADVAPYLNVEASTTMVPAKFVADAFGINYDYTTNPDGTVADVIFAN